VAGTPAYYSEQPMINLLVKRDREIASRESMREIHACHNIIFLVMRYSG